MATQTYEAPPREHPVEILTQRREETQTRRRGGKSNLAPFSEAESDPKPLVAFDVPPVPAALPQTW
jgi:hypothetical protein